MSTNQDNATPTLLESLSQDLLSASYFFIFHSLSPSHYSEQFLFYSYKFHTNRHSEFTGGDISTVMKSKKNNISFILVRVVFVCLFFLNSGSRLPGFK